MLGFTAVDCIKDEMVKEENSQVVRFAVRTNGRTNLEQELAYAITKKTGATRNLENAGKDSRAGKLIVIP